MVMAALIFFLIGAIVAALSNDFGTLLVGRSFQGIGGGGLIALTEVLVTDLIPLRLRGQWFGIISAMWSIGSVTGPIIGGAFAQNVTWVRSPGSRFACITVRLMNPLAMDLLAQPPVHWSGISRSPLDSEAGF